ncbi:SDR family NAD(P)-dependent oxidoreductase [Frigidibacter mobilis]|uniref:Short-chain dehydrogenase/reductase family oxidoreductase n=1 Tax=Frigidibacter mobilis TaxID=1335048 RepID=A0A159Z2Z3_9RHOB|nr:SDR family NAD(P)-dependent oxidoreductase [Frigidibacter mobilis]AMY69442.1 short-chain dehydrogenase/reductase family oxidoreductase [Frigidibacter mobilis]
MTDSATPPAPIAPKPAPKLALVTGASRGLGAAMAEALAAQGWHVMAVARTTGALEELDDRIQAAGGQATLAPMDVTDPEAMAHLASAIAGRWGSLQLWVHTAIHAAPLAPAAHMDAKDMAKSIATNLTATATLIGLLEPLLRAGHGTALMLDDPRGGEKFFGSYGATKAAQMALVRSWQAETVKIGPRVVIAEPAPMATATRARFYPGEDRAPLADTRAEANRLIARL